MKITLFDIFVFSAKVFIISLLATAVTVSLLLIWDVRIPLVMFKILLSVVITSLITMAVSDIFGN